jgi:hypothetical protein
MNAIHRKFSLKLFVMPLLLMVFCWMGIRIHTGHAIDAVENPKGAQDNSMTISPKILEPNNGEFQSGSSNHQAALNPDLGIFAQKNQIENSENPARPNPKDATSLTFQLRKKMAKEKLEAAREAALIVKYEKIGTAKSEFEADQQTAEQNGSREIREETLRQALEHKTRIALDEFQTTMKAAEELFASDMTSIQNDFYAKNNSEPGDSAFPGKKTGTHLKQETFKAFEPGPGEHGIYKTLANKTQNTLQEYRNALQAAKTLFEAMSESLKIQYETLRQCHKTRFR